MDWDKVASAIGYHVSKPNPQALAVQTSSTTFPFLGNLLEGSTTKGPKGKGGTTTASTP